MEHIIVVLVLFFAVFGITQLIKDIFRFLFWKKKCWNKVVGEYENWVLFHFENLVYACELIQDRIELSKTENDYRRFREELLQAKILLGQIKSTYRKELDSFPEKVNADEST